MTVAVSVAQALRDSQDESARHVFLRLLHNAFGNGASVYIYNSPDAEEPYATVECAGDGPFAVDLNTVKAAGVRPVSTLRVRARRSSMRAS